MRKFFALIACFVLAYFFTSCTAKHHGQQIDETEQLRERVVSYMHLLQSGNENDIKNMYHNFEVPYYRYLHDFSEYKRLFRPLDTGAEIVEINIKKDKKNEFVYKIDLTLEKKGKKLYNVGLNWVKVANKFYNIKRHKAFFPEL